MYRRQIGCLIGMVILLVFVSVTLAGTVSEEAQRYMARGMAAVEMANTPKDYERAVREFEQAAKLAPNWQDVYFNLGSVHTKAGNYGEAMRHYKRYLELAPNAPDAAKIREEIYKLEYRAEEQMVKEIKRDGRFIAYDNETVLDTQTNLMWAAKDNGAGIDWQDAKKYCENYRGGGYTDWRMPTLNELAGLYDAAKTYSSECPGFFDGSHPDVHLTELIRLTCVALWAFETRGSVAAQFDFNGGGRYWFPPVTGPIYRGLPVRSVKVKIGNPQGAVPNSGKASVPSNATAVQQGTRTYANGDKYAGEFTDRKFNGRGTYSYANGDKYVGEFVDGKFTSRGTFTCSNGKQFTKNLENIVPLEFTIRCN
jgi:hypothetical protein